MPVMWSPTRLSCWDLKPLRNNERRRRPVARKSRRKRLSTTQWKNNKMAEMIYRLTNQTMIEVRLVGNMEKNELRHANNKQNTSSRPNSVRKGRRGKITPKIKKRSSKWRIPKEPYAEVSAFDDTYELILFNKRNCEVAITITLSL